LNQAPSTEQRLRCGTPQHRVDDWEEVHFAGMQVSIALVAAAHIIFIFVDLFQLTKYDSSGNNTISIIVVVNFMKVPERRDTFEHVLHSVMFAEIWNELPMI
jgi:hypothetical protein